MKLQEKLCKPFIYLQTETLNELEQIADDYAIGFAYYLLDKNDKPNGEFTIKELLEMYKKEKGL